MARRFLPSGVIGSGNRDTTDPSLKATLATIGTPTWNVPAGEAFVQGIKYTNDGPLTKTAALNSNSLARIDRLVLKLDPAADTCTAIVIAGTPSSTPVSPGLPDTADVIHLPLFRATLPGSGSAQNYEGLIDERLFVGTREYVGPVTGLGPSIQPGDMWLQPDTKERLMWLNNRFVGTRQRLFTGVPIGSSGTYGAPAGQIATYAKIDIPALPYDYQVQFSAHLQVGGLGSGNYIVGTIRDGDVGTGTIRAQGTAVAINNLDAPLSFPPTNPLTVSAGQQRTFWFNVVPNVDGSFVWNAPDNWFAAEITPVW